jgi:Cof subfamily protein (haloacid dehalogenase superfamily)
LLCTDLDGTLLDDNGNLSPRNAAALTRALDQGVAVAYATGRPAAETLRLLGRVPLPGVVAVSNGAALYDVTTQLPLSPRVALGSRAASAVLRAVREALPGALIGADLGERVLIEPGFAAAANVQWDHVVRPDTHRVLEAQGAVKILVVSPDRPIDVAAGLLQRALAGIAEVTRSTTQFIEVSPRGVDKGAALRRIAELLNIQPGATAAIGDMPNDIPMLRAAAFSGAVANAHQSVRAAVDTVVASHADHGVADFVEIVLQNLKAGQVGRRADSNSSGQCATRCPTRVH